MFRTNKLSLTRHEHRPAAAGSVNAVLPSSLCALFTPRSVSNALTLATCHVQHIPTLLTAFSKPCVTDTVSKCLYINQKQLITGSKRCARKLIPLHSLKNICIWHKYPTSLIHYILLKEKQRYIVFGSFSVLLYIRDNIIETAVPDRLCSWAASFEMLKKNYLFIYLFIMWSLLLQCNDAVGWSAGMASGL